MTKFTGTAGNGNLTGSSRADTFDLGHGGSDTVKGGDGADLITALAGTQDSFV